MAHRVGGFRSCADPLFGGCGLVFIGTSFNHSKKSCVLSKKVNGVGDDDDDDCRYSSIHPIYRDP